MSKKLQTEQRTRELAWDCDTDFKSRPPILPIVSKMSLSFSAMQAHPPTEEQVTAFSLAKRL